MIRTELLSKSPITSAAFAARGLLAAATLSAIVAAAPADAAVDCGRTIKAAVSVIDIPILFNRLGAQNPNWMAYVLDVDLRNGRLRPDKRLRPIVLRVPAGACLEVQLTNRLTRFANPNNAINQAHPSFHVDDQVAERRVGFHVHGLELASTIGDDASFVGRNRSSLVPVGSTRTYLLYAPHEGAYFVSNPAATFGGDASAGNSGSGLFGIVNVEPRESRFYRSQVTEEELRLATVKDPVTGAPALTPAGQPIIDYEARYPNTTPWSDEQKAGRPILNMLDGNVLVHSDINAIIAGPNTDGTFPPETYPDLEGSAKFNPALPNRFEPFREFTSVFHDENSVGQAFPGFFLNPVTAHTLHGVRDTFMVNYGSGGIGAEIIANRLGVGPMHDCLACSYEEFFLTSFTVGDPALLVDTPANIGLENVAPGQAPPAAALGPKATKALFPDDPSNVHHSYIGDFVKYRNVHAGKEHHIFHLHNHQWLFNPNDDNSNYIDAQAVGPGSGYTYEINYGGSGNRNKTAGDAIYHCHFYPHFAQGMWHLWRIHDTLQTGTPLAVSANATGFHTQAYALRDGEPAVVGFVKDANGADTNVPMRGRALPDGEIVAGTPIPAVVPLPGKPIAPMPGAVNVVPNPLTKRAARGHPNAGALVPVGSLAKVARPVTINGEPRCDNGGPATDCTDPAAPNPRNEFAATEPEKAAGLNPQRLKNPGYPFWIAGIEDIVGQRPPTPPLDMWAAAGGSDGGLPRHTLKGYVAGGATAVNEVTRLEFTKIIGRSDAAFYPEEGTDIEKVAMAYHATRTETTYRQTTFQPSAPVPSAVIPQAPFVRNGAMPVPGAPYQDPCIDDAGQAVANGVFWKSQAEATQVSSSMTRLARSRFFDANGGLSFTGPTGRARLYQGANIQFDAVFNKAGYHYPQQRILALWSDVLPTINKQRAPEPLVMRNNTFDCTMYQHTNLVPEAFELDDYQVRTPTDIIGQHIHLPKWDLTTADGAANGWNYEDGTLSPGVVRERIEAINCFNGELAECRGGLQPVRDSTLRFHAEPHPVLGTGPRNEWLGARVTLQRWFFDPVFNVKGQDRGLGIIFTHDHYGPSTHQQIGLYATVLVEPAGSTWYHNETGRQLYDGREDGGPTSWQAAIVSRNASGLVTDAFREFYLEFSDFQHAYQPGVYVGRNQDGSIGPRPDENSFRESINPPYRQGISADKRFPDVSRFPPVCPGGVPRPCPEAITADDSGMLVVNYRNEPVGLRVYDPEAIGPDGKPGAQASGLRGDLAFALQSRTDRAIPHMNVQPRAGTDIKGTKFPPPLNASGVNPGDPFTPMPRAYYGDAIRVRIQAGGHEHSHGAAIHGMKWLQGGAGFGAAPNSGWRNHQHSGISEQFTLKAPIIPAFVPNPNVPRLSNTADYAYSVNAAQDGWWSGTWGIIRTYRNAVGGLFALPNNPPGRQVNGANFTGVCPTGATTRSYDVTAVLANDVLGNAVGATLIPNDRSASGHVGALPNPAGGTLVYNPVKMQLVGAPPEPNEPGDDNGTGNVPATSSGPLHDPTAMLWVRTDDLNPGTCRGPRGAPGQTNMGCAVKLKANAPIEPIVLRVAAGDCVSITVRNRLPPIAPDLGSYTEYLRVVRRSANDSDANNSMTTFNANLVRPSSYVGIHTALLAYDVRASDGTVVGGNPDRAVVEPGASRTFQFYAGDVDFQGGSSLAVAQPLELGGAIIGPADKLKQAGKGLVGALVVVPAGSRWPDAGEPTYDHQTDAKTKDRLTRAAATVSVFARPADTTPTRTFRDFAHVIIKGQSHRHGDGTSVENISAEGGTIPEDSEDSGQMSVNYGSEPLWFRFGLKANVPFGNTAGGLGAVPNAGDAYSNLLRTGLTGASGPTTFGEPSTPVFEAAPGEEFRLRVVHPSGVGRGSIMTLHGHVWQRTPYGCGVSGTSVGICPAGDLGSRDIGQSPISFYLGAQEQIIPYSHFDLVLPSAGGTGAIPGDYLFRDVGSFGNLGGLWNIVRVGPRE